MAITLAQMLDNWSVVPVAASLVKLGVPDAVPAEGQIEISTVAKTVGCSSEMLHRAIRFTSGFGCFHEHQDGKVSHTEQSLQIRTGGAMYNKVLFRACKEVMTAWTEGLEKTIKEPEISAFKHTTGDDFLMEWLPKNHKTEVHFANLMKENSDKVLPLIAESYPWPEKGVICDVGGSHGHLVKALLDKLPGTTGVLFDLETTIENAKNHWPTGDVMHGSRVSYQSGDFIAGVGIPTADVYTLKCVLHDWSDDSCITIMKNIRAAAKPDSKAVIIDMMVDDTPNSHHISKLYDMNMAVLVGGKERTTAQMRIIAEASGWALGEVVQAGKSPLGCFTFNACSAPSGGYPGSK